MSGSPCRCSSRALLSKPPPVSRSSTSEWYVRPCPVRPAHKQASTHTPSPFREVFIVGAVRLPPLPLLPRSSTRAGAYPRWLVPGRVRQSVGRPIGRRSGQGRLRPFRSQARAGRGRVLWERAPSGCRSVSRASGRSGRWNARFYRGDYGEQGTTSPITGNGAEIRRSVPPG